MYFDRFDICAAYAQLEADYNVGGALQERDAWLRRNMSVGYQLMRMGYRPGRGGTTLSENAQVIYDNARERLGLV